MEEDDQGGPASAEVGDVAGVIEDLEQQAAGMLLAERDAELVDRARGEYATVALSSRVHASIGRPVVLDLWDGGSVEGLLDSAGKDWFLLTSMLEAAGPAGGGGVTLVRTAAVAAAGGLSDRAVPEAARPIAARLGIGSALHRLTSGGAEVVVSLVTGTRLRGQLGRVGSDFVELDGPAGVRLLPFEALMTVRT